MRRHRIGCLPVVQDGHIVAVVTEEDFVGIAGKVLTEAASSTDVNAAAGGVAPSSRPPPRNLGGVRGVAEAGGGDEGETP